MIARLTRLFRRPPSGTDDIHLVTANFGGIDEVRPLPPSDRVRSFYYTEQATLEAADPAAVGTWSKAIVPNYPRHDFNPRLRGRYFKHQIHRLPESIGARWLVWADANVLFHETEFLVRAAMDLARRPPHQRLLLIPHHHRNTVREEYETIQHEIENGNEYLRIRYGSEKMPEQMAFFAEQGWDVDVQLWCGTVWLVENSPLMNQCWDAWWDQNLRFGMMDQLSLTVVLRNFGVEPQRAPFSLIDNPHFKWGVHAKLA